MITDTPLCITEKGTQYIFFFFQKVFLLSVNTHTVLSLLNSYSKHHNMKCVSPNENYGCFHNCGDIITLTSIGTFQLPETSDLAPESSDMKRLLNPKVLVTCATLQYLIKFDVSVRCFHEKQLSTSHDQTQYWHGVDVNWIFVITNGYY